MNFVVDSCSIAEFQSERVAGEGGMATGGLEAMLQSGWVLLDEGGIIKQEWLNTCSASSTCELSLSDWIDDKIAEGAIRLEIMHKDRKIKKDLRMMGVQNKDANYVFLAHSGHARAIATEDVDLHDPTAKSRPGRRRRIMEDKTGAVCRYIKKEVGADVCKVREISGIIEAYAGEDA